MNCCDQGKERIKTNSEKNATFFCPRCESKGVKVDLATPKSLLKDCCVGKLHDELIYKFCTNQECDIAYFSVKRNHSFTKDELKVKATLKDKGLDVKTCYCFGFTRQSIVREIRETGKSTVVETIKAKMKNPGCFCKTSNPEGRCCLSNNITYVQEALESCLDTNPNSKPNLET